MADRPISHNRVRHYLDDVLCWLSLGHVQCTLTTKAGELVDDDRNLTGTCRIENRGMSAHIEIACGRTWDQVRRTTIHECVHVATWEMRQVLWNLEHILGMEAYRALCWELEDAEERLVLRIERALVGALDDKDKPA